MRGLLCVQLNWQVPERTLIVLRCAAMRTGEDGGEEADVEEYAGYSAAFARLHNAQRCGQGAGPGGAAEAAARPPYVHKHFLALL